MSNMWENFLLEIGFLSLLGVLYYFYQRRKIIQYEEKKGPIVMGYILQSMLTEKEEHNTVEGNAIIEAIDDYLHNRSLNPPLALLKIFAQSKNCSPELKEVILAGLAELD